MLKSIISLLWVISHALGLQQIDNIDLLEDIASRFEMMPVTGFHQNTTSAYAFTESMQRYRLSSKIESEVIKTLTNGREFVFVATIRQERKGQGVLFSMLRDGNQRILDIQSNWKKREVRLNYLVSLHMTQIFTERLPFDLADGQWHQLALSFSGLRLTMYVDCQKIYTRTLKYVLSASELVKTRSIWLGQRGGLRKNSNFLGAVEEMKIVLTDDATYVRSCRDSMHENCPSCNHQIHLTSLVYELQEKMKQLSDKLASTENSIADLRKCECLRACKVGSLKYNDGEKWDTGKCHYCECRNGKIICKEKECPPTDCPYPVKDDNECCPRCSATCNIRGVIYQHGEARYKAKRRRKLCVVCKCQHGRIYCERPRNVTDICPKLDCPVNEQLQVREECCNVCKNTDFCALSNHRCHKDADCINLRTKHTCKCKTGFKGNGYYCKDINECEERRRQPLCMENSVCENKPGSFECKCNPGYIKDSQINQICVEHDECSTGAHNCHPKAICKNTKGSYTCSCPKGYRGNGYNCTAICNCENGGTCISPNTCECPTGFRGARCEIDIDECDLKIDKCAPNSTCMNIPGSYHCICKPGFTDFGKSNEFGKRCTDINECLDEMGRLYTCNSDMTCRNTIGSYECVCKKEKDCTKSCRYDISRRIKRPLRNGASFYDPLSACQYCKCRNGKITCKPVRCNCEDYISQICCPQCTRTKRPRRCWRGASSFKSGSSWVENCRNCTCKNGRTTCQEIVCPSTASCPTTPVQLDGHCCKICSSDNVCQRNVTLNPFSPGGYGHCQYKGISYKHAEKWSLPNDLCITCQCKFGHVCCTHKLKCRATSSNVT